MWTATLIHFISCLNQKAVSANKMINFLKIILNEVKGVSCQTYFKKLETSPVMKKNRMKLNHLVSQTSLITKRSVKILMVHLDSHFFKHSKMCYFRTVFRQWIAAILNFQTLVLSLQLKTLKPTFCIQLISNIMLFFRSKFNLHVTSLLWSHLCKRCRARGKINIRLEFCLNKVTRLAIQISTVNTIWTKKTIILLHLNNPSNKSSLELILQVSINHKQTNKQFCKPKSPQLRTFN